MTQNQKSTLVERTSLSKISRCGTRSLRPRTLDV